MHKADAVNYLKNPAIVAQAEKNQFKKSPGTACQDFKKELELKVAEANTASQNAAESADCNALKFSKHALSRINARGINLTQAQIASLNDAATKAGDKGIKDSLVMLNDTAFILNVQNKTVITAMGMENFKQKVITNIDGVVIL